MEIHPSSSISQAGALFTDFSEEKKKKEAFNIFPYAGPNILLESTNRDVATSFTSDESGLFLSEKLEGEKMIQGQLMYPFPTNPILEHNYYDPSYFDGSIIDENFNVQENLIGTPLGVSHLHDPRLSYVENMLKLKEHHSNNSGLDDAYLKELFMTNIHRGTDYYLNQLRDLKPSLDDYSRVGRESKNRPLDPVVFDRHLNRGVTTHNSIREKTKLFQSSSAGNIQYNYRRERMNRRHQSDPYRERVSSSIPTNKNRNPYDGFSSHSAGIGGSWDSPDIGMQLVPNRGGRENGKNIQLLKDGAKFALGVGAALVINSALSSAGMSDIPDFKSL